MQTKILRSAFALVISVLLFSFTTSKWGGDRLQVWLNDKMVVEQFMHIDKSVKNVVLTEANYNDKMFIRYSHCGLTGKERTITLKDAQDRVVKQWHFANTTSNNDQMSCPVKEILDLQKLKSNVSLKVVYASKEIPNGQVLVSLTKSNTAVASR